MRKYGGLGSRAGVVTSRVQTSSFQTLLPWYVTLVRFKAPKKIIDDSIHSSISNFKMTDQQHGNYKGYYRKRSYDTDERITNFQSEWFLGKKCIDIGCNEGAVTLKIAEILTPNFILGIDLDPRMIDAADAALKRTKYDSSRSSIDLTATAHSAATVTDFAPVKRLNQFLPRSIALSMTPVALIPSSSARSSSFENTTLNNIARNSNGADFSGKFPSNVSFVCKNIIDFTSSAATYDVVLCLSVTKWIHLTEGDSGLLTLFRIIHQLTSPGGRAIIEYQSWSSYLNNKKTSATTLRVFDTLKIRPEDFELILTKGTGFRIEARLGTPLAQAKGFKRPILVLIKDACNVAVPGSIKMEDEAMDVEYDTAAGSQTNSTLFSNVTASGNFMGRKRYFGELDPSDAEDMLDETDTDCTAESFQMSSNLYRRKKK